MTTPPPTPRNSRSPRRQPRAIRGFTLIELVLTCVIIGLVATVAAPRYSAAQNRYHLEASARRVTADLVRAREHALATSGPVVVRFDTAAMTVLVEGLPALNDPSTDHLTRLSRPPYETLLTSADFDGVTSLTFDGFGNPSAGGEVVLTRGSLSKQVNVSGDLGRVTMP